MIEAVAIVALFFVLGGDVPPGVNEAHYLAKAKHYWNPEWCAGDPFLESADAHLVFYWTLGWLTRLTSLTAVAWVGRFVVWLLLAVSLQRLVALLVPGKLRGVLIVGLFAALQSWGHMSGEWVVGGVEAKCVAYALVFFGLEALVRGRWNSTWLLLGTAAAFHVLVGGWAVVAAMFSWTVSGDRPRVGQMLPALVGGFLLSLPGLAPALSLGRNVDSTTRTAANEIYVHQRLDHHLVFHEILRQKPAVDLRHWGLPLWRWPMTHGFLLRHLVVFGIWCGLVLYVRPTDGARRFHAFVAGAAVICAAGILIDQATLYAPQISAQLLRFYWYRLSDALLPLGAAVAVGQAAARLARTRPKLADGCLLAVLFLVGLFVADAYVQRYVDRRPAAVRQAGPRDADSDQRYADWRAACQWIQRNTPPHELVLTPRHQQTFKWYAERPEVVNWKDVPQDAPGIVDWWQRKKAVYPREVERDGLAALGEERLRELATEYGFRYVIVDRRPGSEPLRFPRVFPFAGPATAYEIYRVSPPDVPPDAPPDAIGPTDSEPRLFETTEAS